MDQKTAVTTHSTQITIDSQIRQIYYLIYLDTWYHSFPFAEQRIPLIHNS